MDKTVVTLKHGKDELKLDCTFTLHHSLDPQRWGSRERDQLQYNTKDFILILEFCLWFWNSVKSW